MIIVPFSHGSVIRQENTLELLSGPLHHRRAALRIFTSERLCDRPTFVFAACELFWSDLVRTPALPNEPVRFERLM